MGDGVYTIDPDGEGGEAPFKVYCDMTTDGGGWTKIIYGEIVKQSREEILDYLSHFGNISQIGNTLYKDYEKGIGWGTNDNILKNFVLNKNITFKEFKVVFLGSYNNPSSGLGYLMI